MMNPDQEELLEQELVILEELSTYDNMYDLLEAFLTSLGIKFRRTEQGIFAHFDVKGAKRFIEHLIKSVGSISARTLAIAEETHPTLAERILIELTEKTRLKDLYEKLNLRISGVFVVTRNKGMKKLPNMRKVSEYTVGFPETVSDIAEFLSEFKFDKISNTIAGKITKSLIAYLLIKANEFKFDSYNREGTPVFLVIWSEKLIEEKIEAIEDTIIDMF